MSFPCTSPTISQRASLRQSAVTLTEVVIAMGVIIILLAMLVPSLGAARERMHRVQCANNLRQWGMALQVYRQDYFDYIPTEGHANTPATIGAWYNTLPKYLGFPAYKDITRIEDQIEEFPALHLWICPSKVQTRVYKSESGKNQFHYGMNQVLDGLGKPGRPSKDAPGFFDLPNEHLRAGRFRRRPNTVFMFDIAPNSSAGTQRNVATTYQRDWRGARMGEFHGDYANLVYLDGRVANCTTDELVADHDFRYGQLSWNLPKLYWGWKPPRTPDVVD